MSNFPPNPLDAKNARPFNCASKPPRPRPPASKSQPNLTKLHSSSSGSATNAQPNSHLSSHHPHHHHPHHHQLHPHSHSHSPGYSLHANNRHSVLKGKLSKIVEKNKDVSPTRNGAKRSSTEWNEISILLLCLFLIWSFIALNLQSSLKPSNDRFPQSSHRDTWKSLVWSPRGLKSNASSPPNNSPDQLNLRLPVQQSYRNFSGSVLTSTPTNSSFASQTLEKSDLASKVDDLTSNKTMGKHLRGRSRVLDTASESSFTMEPHVRPSSDEGKFHGSGFNLGIWAGPFDDLEDVSFQRNQVFNKLAKRYDTTCRVMSFSKLLLKKSVILVMHETSLTGAPLSIFELAEEMKKCGVRVMVVVLNKKGGLIPELKSRGIPLLDDKKLKSWSIAAKSDLIVASSSSCASWINGLLNHYPSSSKRLVWWMMENRREYYNVSKSLLSFPSALIFLSQSQASLWKDWSRSDGLNLTDNISVIGLSINAKISLVAGLDEPIRNNLSLSNSAAQMRQEMRNEVRAKLGLNQNDVLVLMLSSVNPGKGQLFVLEAVLNLTARLRSKYEIQTPESLPSSMTNPGSLSHITSQSADTNDLKGAGSQKAATKEENLSGEGIRKGVLALSKISERNSLAPSVKLLIGSMNSKSNKVEYLEKMNGLLHLYEKYADSVIWVNATTKVLPLYCAADVYAMNAQGIGETFGRVTIEAMAFGLPVLGSNMGGTVEIVEHKSTGLLHSTGKKGVEEMVDHLHSLLKDRNQIKEMGRKAKETAQKLHMDIPMYDKMAKVFSRVLTNDNGYAES